MAPSSKLQEGSRKGPSFLFVLIPVGVMLALAAGALALPSLGRLMLPPDPVNAFIKLHYDQCRKSWCHTPSMIPEIFAGGEPKQAIADRLAKAGFRPYGDDFINADADSVFMACDINYYVTVEFDENERLTAASGQTASVCM